MLLHTFLPSCRLSTLLPVQLCLEGLIEVPHILTLCEMCGEGPSRLCGCDGHDSTLKDLLSSGCRVHHELVR